ncbi:hypothetical protein PF008_g7572 [Phytophthora fragariae]|uniref:Uncharacterized protein n=1 Tax=Phytophthora fragariae TaxID=53985 RepID=A0A6G0S2P5_9STRA|nr:hypothetical protein PF008_g7572 [Phytophthora fragariae]
MTDHFQPQDEAIRRFYAAAAARCRFDRRVLRKVGLSNEDLASPASSQPPRASGSGRRPRRASRAACRRPPPAPSARCPRRTSPAAGRRSPPAPPATSGCIARYPTREHSPSEPGTCRCGGAPQAPAEEHARRAARERGQPRTTGLHAVHQAAALGHEHEEAGRTRTRVRAVEAVMDEDDEKAKQRLHQQKHRLRHDALCLTRLQPFIDAYRQEKVKGSLDSPLTGSTTMPPGENGASNSASLLNFENATMAPFSMDNEWHFRFDVFAGVMLL